MKLSNRRVKKAKQKLRNGRQINNSELSILNLYHRRQFQAQKIIQMALLSVSSAMQMAMITSKPTPLADQKQKEEARLNKGLEIAELCEFTTNGLQSLMLEEYKNYSRKAFLLVYCHAHRSVGNYDEKINFCNTPKPIEDFTECKPIYYGVDFGIRVPHIPSVIQIHPQA